MTWPANIPPCSRHCGRRTSLSTGVCKRCRSKPSRPCRLNGCTAQALPRTTRCALHHGERDNGTTVVTPGTRYREDVGAQIFVATFPGGATLEAVGDALSVSRERIRQIETKALAHFAARLRLAGIDEEAARAVLTKRVAA